METELKNSIKKLAEKSQSTTENSVTPPALAALQYSQAALNLAHALVVLQNAGVAKD